MNTATPKFCEECGKPLAPGSRFCEECGHKVADAAASSAAGPTPLPAVISPPAFSPPPLAVSPPAVAAAPGTTIRGGRPIKAILIAGGLLILAGIWVFQLPAGRQLVLQVTGQPPAASSLATPPPGQSQTIPGGEAQTIAATTSAPADDFTTLATELATDISPPPADPPPADPPPADPPADPIAVAQKWVDRGFADEQAGNLQEAVAAYEQALEITGDRKLATHIQQVKRNFNIEPSAVPEPTIEPESAPAPAPIPEPEPAPVPAKVRVTPRMTQAAVMLHTTGNIAAVLNGATQANTFVIAEPMVVTSITTYHWNNAKGKTPGTISLKHVDGTKYGAWQATGRDGQKGVPNATWSVSPGVVLKPGKYTLLDSDPPTWSQNAGTGGKGMCEIKGLPWRQVGAGR